jgi:hypothetical protein
MFPFEGRVLFTWSDMINTGLLVTSITLLPDILGQATRRRKPINFQRNDVLPNKGCFPDLKSNIQVSVFGDHPFAPNHRWRKAGPCAKRPGGLFGLEDLRTRVSASSELCSRRGERGRALGGPGRSLCGSPLGWHREQLTNSQLHKQNSPQKIIGECSVPSARRSGGVFLLRSAAV